jgi:uncharacterized membrane protein
MALAASGLAFFLLAWKPRLDHESSSPFGWLFSGDAAAARELLGNLLSGMITITALVVSITMVVFSLAAGQLGPRLIWAFVRDRQIQAVLGLFIGTIFYLLVVLRSIGGVDREHVPQLAVSVGSALSAACLFALLFHVHKVSRMIISDTIVRDVSQSLEGLIQTLPAAQEEAQAEQTPPLAPYLRPIILHRSGYVQVVDYRALCQLAARHDVALSFQIRAGDFLLKGSIAAVVLSGNPIADQIDTEIRDAIVVGEVRSPAQDLEFSVRQMVEVAVRALSPGINDPFTAIAVVHRLGAALESLGERQLPPSGYRDANGTLRIWARTNTYEGLVDTAFDQIRQAARENAAVLIEIARTLTQLALVVSPRAQKSAILRQARILRSTGCSFIPDPSDRQDFEREMRNTIGALEKAVS